MKMSMKQKNVPKLRFPEFTEEWKQHKLGEIGVARSGVGFPDSEQGGLEGTPFFKVSDMNTEGNENELITANNYVTDEQINRKRWTVISDVPAIFFAKVGAAVMLNRKRLVRVPFLLDNNTMAYIFNKDAWDCDFGKTLFETIDLTKLTQVGALPSYNSSDVEEVMISIPKRSEQETIGRYFKQLDTLISLQQRKLDQIKEYKRGMLQKMFPKECESVPEVRFPGFNGEWAWMKIGDFIRFVGGATPSKTNTEYWDGDIVWLSSQEINKGGFVDCGTYTITQKAIDDGTTRIVKANTPLIISRSGILAHSFPVTRPTIDVAINQDIKALIFDKDRYSTDFIVFLMEQKAPHILKSIVKTGTTVQSVNMPDLEKLVVPIPSVKEQQNVGNFFLGIDNLITLHQRKLDAMKEYKKGLLQQMFV